MVNSISWYLENLVEFSVTMWAVNYINMKPYTAMLFSVFQMQIMISYAYFKWQGQVNKNSIFTLDFLICYV